MNEPKNPKVIKLNPKTARNKKNGTAKLNPPKKPALKYLSMWLNNGGGLQRFSTPCT